MLLSDSVLGAPLPALLARGEACRRSLLRGLPRTLTRRLIGCSTALELWVDRPPFLQWIVHALIIEIVGFTDLLSHGVRQEDPRGGLWTDVSIRSTATSPAGLERPLPPNAPTRRHRRRPGRVNCAACGAPLPSAARFAASARGRSAPPRCAKRRRSRTRRRTSPRRSAARVEAIEGERKRVTVLFADLHGSMELVADRDPEEARALLDARARVDDGGGAPLRGHRQPGPRRRHHGALRRAGGARGPRGARLLRGAAHAGQHQPLRSELAPGTGELVRIRVGLNSGEVVVRAIAGDLHMDYTAVGQTTHLASRMEQMAEPGTILATAELARLVEGYVQTRRQGERSIRGLAQPVEVFEVLGAVPLRTRVQIAERRGLRPLRRPRGRARALGRA